MIETISLTKTGRRKVTYTGQTTVSPEPAILKYVLRKFLPTSLNQRTVVYTPDTGEMFCGAEGGGLKNLSDVIVLKDGAFLPGIGVENKLYVVITDTGMTFSIWDGTAYHTMNGDGSVSIFRDNIVETDSVDDFPTVGSEGVLYIDRSSGDIYRYDVATAAYVVISAAISPEDSAKIQTIITQLGAGGVRSIWAELARLESVKAEKTDLTVIENNINNNTTAINNINIKLNSCQLNCQSKMAEIEAAIASIKADLYSNIISIENVKSQTVAYGTKLEDIVLANKTLVTLDDNSLHEVYITWDTSSYDRNTAGTYVFAGTMKLPKYYKNPSGFTVSTSITVGENPAATPDTDFTHYLLIPKGDEVINIQEYTSETISFDDVYGENAEEEMANDNYEAAFAKRHVEISIMGIAPAEYSETVLTEDVALAAMSEDYEFPADGIHFPQEAEGEDAAIACANNMRAILNEAWDVYEKIYYTYDDMTGELTIPTGAFVTGVVIKIKKVKNGYIK